MLEKYKNYVTVKATGLDIKHGLPIDQWLEVGEQLKRMETGLQWWLGDWLNYGEGEYGERYTQAVDDTDYAKGSLYNFTYVCRSIETSRRRENVSFSQHAEVASLDPELQDRILDEVEDKDLSKHETRLLVKKSKYKTPVIKDGKYQVIYADPPWDYGDKLIKGYGAAEHHYPSMTIEELCDLNIFSLADNNAVLFLWVTSPLLEDSFRVIKAWGFEYKTSFVWDKIKHNYGHYNSVRHEFLLVCTRGSFTPQSSKLFDSVQTIERKLHSEKPEEFRQIIEELYKDSKKIELFARSKHKNWEVWGNDERLL